MLERTSPFLEILYTSLVTILGSIATYSTAHSNLVDILLVKVVHILTASIETNRELRNQAVEKHLQRLNHAQPHRTNTTSSMLQRSPELITVPEICMIREILLAGN